MMACCNILHFTSFCLQRYCFIFIQATNPQKYLPHTTKLFAAQTVYRIGPSGATTPYTHSEQHDKSYQEKRYEEHPGKSFGAIAKAL